MLTGNSPLTVVVPTQFQSTPEGMFRLTTRSEGISQIQLTNYTAVVVTNVLLDDGVEKKREFELECELLGRKYNFTVPASEFASMDWPIKQMGCYAVTFPNQREYARAAIQSQSYMAVERCTYSHTGWREIGGRWIFLHASGAIGASGILSDISVHLQGSMSRYELRIPAPDTAAHAIAASLRLVDLGPAPVSFALLAATTRAVWGEPDFAIHLAGPTGAFKSEFAALHQQHFGSGMDRMHLPGAWSSTGNALEVVAFRAKDALLVIDDFAPQGTTIDIARSHSTAERVIRAVGNQAGRSRLDSTAALREAKTPRAMILSTGEEIPKGQSIRARLLILEIAKGALTSSALSLCQIDAHAGLYAEAMGGYIRYLAGNYVQVKERFRRRVAALRAVAATDTGHARTPEITANLQAAFEMYLEYAVACRAINDNERERLTDRCWKALSEAAKLQTPHQRATEPTSRFLELVRSLLTSGEAHLQSREGDKPDGDARAAGWHSLADGNWAARGDCVGWVDGTDIYLEATTTYRLAQAAARQGGDNLSVTEQTLKKRLHEKGQLASIDEKRGTLTIRRSICGVSRSVLHISRGTLLPEGPNDTDEEDR
jgi:hypothetical protein